MDLFAVSDRAKRYQADLLAFMDECVYPAEPVYEEQMRASGDPHHQPAIIEELKARGAAARAVEPVPPAPGVGSRA